MAKKKSKKQIEQITINELINEELSTRTDSLKILDKEFGVLDDISNLFNENIKANKKQADVLGDIVDATKSVLENTADITDETMNHVDLHKLERKLIREGVRDTGQIISKLKEKQNIQKQTNRIVNRQANMFKSIGDTTENLVKQIPLIGGFLSDSLGITGIGDELSNAFRTAFTGQKGESAGFGSAAGAEFAGGFGVSLLSRGKMNRSQRLVRLFFRNAVVAGAASGLILAFTGGVQSMNIFDKLRRLVFRGAFEGLNEAFGNLDKSRGFQGFLNLSRLRGLKFRFGIDQGEAAKILRAQTELSGLSDNQALNIQKNIANFARLRGVIPKDIIKDIADNTKLFAEFAKDGGQNIGLAAVEAKRLGLSLDTVASISDSLLDFQTSIEAELQASLLIGRQLNLNKARELALSGDLAGVQREIVKQIGSEAELNKLNVIQRRKLATALGITVAQLNKLAGGEVEFASSDIDRNTIAMDRLTNSIIAATAIGGGRAILAGRSGLARTVLRSRLVGATAARGLAMGAGAVGFGATGVGAIMGLTIIGKMIYDAINKGNEQASGFYTKQGGNNFQPFMGSGALE